MCELSKSKIRAIYYRNSFRKDFFTKKKCFSDATLEHFRNFVYDNLKHNIRNCSKINREKAFELMKKYQEKKPSKFESE